ncbi:MAG: ERF family protein [Candidatus Dehalobacter alkaniphilus]
MAETNAAADKAAEKTKTTSIPRENLTLQRKFVELRRACPKIVKERHSESVKYKYAKIYDVWEAVTPIMNEVGVNFEIIKEVATKTDEHGNPVYWSTMQIKTSNGDKLMFLYEADLTIQWTDVDNEDDILQVTVHAVGWNDDPAKAKGAAHTYALKYYLFEKFSIDQGEDDPDNNDFSAQGKAGQGQGRGQSNGNTRPGGNGPQNGAQDATGPKLLSDAQLNRLYKKSEAAGMTKEATDKRILEKYHKQNPAALSRAEYDEICEALDAAAVQGGGA